MSSRDGPRATGSDGSDFTHREQVASQYKISAKLKSKLKTHLIINLLLAVLQAVLLISFHLKIIQAEPLPWQYMCLASFISSSIGLMSLPRNTQMYLRLSNAGTVTLGIGGVLYGTLHHFEELKTVLTSGKSDAMVGGVPLVVCFYIVFIIMTIAYMMTLYYANTLINAWSSKKSR